MYNNILTLRMAQTKVTLRKRDKKKKKYKFPTQGLQAIAREQRRITPCIPKVAIAWYIYFFIGINKTFLNASEK